MFSLKKLVASDEKNAEHKGRKRRRILPKYSVEEFFAKAKKMDIKFVVMRWFDDLPDVKSGEDIDVLVADESFKKLLTLVDDCEEGVPIDVYTCGGLPKSSYKKMAYYPPHLANQVIESRIFKDEIYPIPDEKHYFFSFAYHAVYHKGNRSDLPMTAGDKPEIKNPEHSYYKTIQRLADNLGYKVEPNLEFLYNFLHENNWAPTFDAERKICTYNRWLKKFYKTNVSKNIESVKGLGVFVLRNWGYKKGYLPKMVEYLVGYGFNVIMARELTEQEIERATVGLRGGSWGTAKQYPTPSGGPRAIVVAVDPTPKKVTDPAMKEQYPLLTNRRMLKAKRAIRKMMNEERAKGKAVNSLHGSDDEFEAADYLHIIMPELSPLLIETMQQLVPEEERLSM